MSFGLSATLVDDRFVGPDPALNRVGVRKEKGVKGCRAKVACGGKKFILSRVHCSQRVVVLYCEFVTLGGGFVAASSAFCFAQWSLDTRL